MTKASAKFPSVESIGTLSSLPIELVCRAASMAGLRTAIDNGADWIRIEYCEATRMRRSSHPGFDKISIGKAVRYTHDKRRKIALSINATPHSRNWEYLRNVIKGAEQIGIDAIELSDPALMLYCAIHCPHLALHHVASGAVLSSDAVNFLRMQFGVSRISLPKVLSLSQLRQLSRTTKADLEIFGFGEACALVERRQAPENRLPRNVLTMRGEQAHADDTQAFTDASDASAGRCAKIEYASNDNCYATTSRLQDSSPLRLLPHLAAMGVRGIRIETRHSSLNEIAHVTRVWREAIDCCLDDIDHYAVKPSWLAELGRHAHISATG